MGRNIKIEKAGYSIVIDESTGCITELYDQHEVKKVNMVNPDRLFGSVTYTNYSQDAYREITCKHLDFDVNLKYIEIDDKTAVHPVIEINNEKVVCRNNELKYTLVYELDDNCIRINLDMDCDNISQLGINTDFNFIGTVGYPYEGQVLPTSPYTSQNGDVAYYLMAKPNGNWVLLTTQKSIDGWRIEYSKHSYGHFLEGLQILKSFDKVFKEHPKAAKHSMTVRIDFPESYAAALAQINRIYDIPVPVFPVSGGKVGAKLPVQMIGNPVRVILVAPSGTKADISDSILRKNDKAYVIIALKEEGFYRVEVYGKDDRSMDCILYAYPGLTELFKRSCGAIKKPYFNTKAFAEGGVYSWVLCIYTKLFGELNEYNQTLDEFFTWAMPEREDTPAMYSIVPYSHEFEGNIYEPYHIYGSTRIQEQFFAVSIFLEAFKAYRENIYLEYACRIMMNIVKHHIGEDGGVKRIHEGEVIDYTTVTAPAIHVVDLANALSEMHDPRASVFAKVAEGIADFLVRRGFDFPTEGDTSYNDKEMEDGSISCSALSVVYVHFYIKQKPEYIAFAEKILMLHDAWTIYTPDARMYRSSFRWWETIWEGDMDGPGICAGHAWTIWRAEATFYYSIITGDIDRFVDAYNSYVTNICKTDSEGNSYSCYVPDFIPQKPQKGSLVHRYNLIPDSSLSKYVWTRMEYTWFRTSGLHSIGGILVPVNGVCIHEDSAMVFISDAMNLKYFVVGEISGTLRLKTQSTIAFISKSSKLILSKGFLEHSDGLWSYITPDRGLIEIKTEYAEK